MIHSLKPEGGRPNPLRVLGAAPLLLPIPSSRDFGVPAVMRFVAIASMLAMVVVNTLALLGDPGATSLRMARMVGAVLPAALAALLLRRETASRALRVIVVCTLAGCVLWVAVLRSASEWPANLAFWPAVVAAAAILVGETGAIVVTIVGCGAIGVLYGLGLHPIPAFFAAQLTNWLIAAAGMTAFAIAVTRALVRAVRSLIETRDRIAAAREEFAALESGIDGLVRARLATWQHNITVSPAQAAASLERLSDAISEARRVMPDLPEFDTTLVQRNVEELRRGVMLWVWRVTTAAVALQCARNYWLGPRENFGITLMSTLIMLAIGLWARFHAATARTALRIGIAFVSTATLILIPGWMRRITDAPPPFPTWFTGMVIFTFLEGPAVAVVMSVALLVVAGAVSLTHAGASTLVVFNYSVAYASVSWLLWDLPRRLLLALDAQREAAAAAIRERRRLVAVMFHDLRNIVQAATFACEDYLEGQCDASVLLELANRMTGVLADIHFDNPTQRPVQVAASVDGAVSIFSRIAQTKNVSIAVDIGRDLPVLASPSILRDCIIANLLSNAVKFSPSGSAVTVRAAQSGSDVLLEVLDEGAGISDEVLSLYREGDQPLRSTVGTGGETGTGNGLRIVRDYLQRFGGSLELTRRPTRGTRAALRLPLSNGDRQGPVRVAS